MNTTALLKKLEGILEEAGRTRMYGNIEIVIRDGRPSAMHTTKTDKLEGDNPHAKTYR